MVDERDSLILHEVLDERVRQDDKWGANRDMDMLEWFAILSEEHGEVAKEVVEHHLWTAYNRKHPPANDTYGLVKMRIELIQTAAVCVAMIGAIDREL